jgi:hypothetical protein
MKEWSLGVANIMLSTIEVAKTAEPGSKDPDGYSH